MAKYITEVLREINDDVSLFQTTYKKVGNGGPLGRLFYHAFTSQGKFLLPEGEPPYKPDSAPIGMSPVRFIGEINKLVNFCRPDLKQMKRDVMFVQLCEAIHPDEVKILIAVKDQKLTELYPNITRKVVAAAGFIPALTPEEQKQEDKEVKKSVRSRGRPRKSESPQQAQ